MATAGAPPTFATPPGFLGLPQRGERGAAGFCVAGVPLDIGTTNRAGARDGPAAIRRASRMLVDGAHPEHWVAPHADMDLADVGDFAIALGDLAASLAMIEAQAAECRHLVALGGEHGISLPLLRALVGRLGRPVGLLHFDAHLDTWPESFGQRFAHGSPFFHAIEEGLLEPRRMIQVGIRSPVDRETWAWTTGRGVTIVPAQQALEAAHAPGTGTPEIGGFTSWQARGILRRLGGVAFFGMDVVEVAPAYDVSEITALAAATLAWEYLALLGAAGRTGRS